jgi:hypothetical protein
MHVEQMLYSRMYIAHCIATLKTGAIHIRGLFLRSMRVSRPVSLGFYELEACPPCWTALEAPLF